MAEDKNNGFNILSGDSTGGDGSYGVGMINLDNISPVIVDPQEERAYIDMEALHARSKIEKKVRFKPDKEPLVEPNLYWIVWVATQVGNEGPYIYGLGACELQVSTEEGRRIKPGYKSMPEHVNNMDKSLKGKVIAEHMDEKSKGILVKFLEEEHKELWENSRDEVKDALTK
ncbi:YwhD family protein [Salimicrobium halophilum]|uniref:YwhD family protein n=1 Tax=Salimicrobium halophilum TaxID=86666 RepID=A0A1G8T0W9_9BACI|nr:YwhD family protein [Salimicrobium halophilum]SDJ35111.1 YwhD family protein [Salimicrobium halophilum]